MVFRGAMKTSGTANGVCRPSDRGRAARAERNAMAGFGRGVTGARGYRGAGLQGRGVRGANLAASAIFGRR
jgi:hypothetical protein